MNLWNFVYQPENENKEHRTNEDTDTRNIRRSLFLLYAILYHKIESTFFYNQNHMGTRICEKMRIRNMEQMKTQNLEVFEDPCSLCTQFYTIKSSLLFYDQNYLGTRICETLYVNQKMRTRNMEQMKAQNLEVFKDPCSLCTQFYTIESTFYNQNQMGTRICETLYIIQKVRTRNMEEMKTKNIEVFGDPCSLCAQFYTIESTFL